MRSFVSKLKLPTLSILITAVTLPSFAYSAPASEESIRQIQKRTDLSHELQLGFQQSALLKQNSSFKGANLTYLEKIHHTLIANAKISALEEHVLSNTFIENEITLSVERQWSIYSSKYNLGAGYIFQRHKHSAPDFSSSYTDHGYEISNRLTFPIFHQNIFEVLAKAQAINDTPRFQVGASLKLKINQQWHIRTSYASGFNRDQEKDIRITKALIGFSY